MANYKVYLIDTLEAMSLQQKMKVNISLQALFDPIAKAAGYAEGALVHFPAYYISPASHELVICFVPFGLSIANQLPRVTQANGQLEQRVDSDPVIDQHWGLTRFNSNGTVSEVRIRGGGPEAWSKLAFHEAMHNKLQVGNSLHTRFNPCGLSCAVVDESSQLTEAERAAMVAALPNNVPQWAQAQKIMVNAGQAKGQGDPLWELPLSKKA
jgi:hypothetical protein